MAPVQCTSGLAPFFLAIGFLPLAFFRLQNIKHCLVVSLYFSRFLPFTNSYPQVNQVMIQLQGTPPGIMEAPTTF